MTSLASEPSSELGDTPAVIQSLGGLEGAHNGAKLAPRVLHYRCILALRQEAPPRDTVALKAFSRSDTVILKTEDSHRRRAPDSALEYDASFIPDAAGSCSRLSRLGPPISAPTFG